MKKSIVVKIILGLCGLLIIIPGVIALLSPENFTGRNGEDISGKISVLNDYRATGMFMIGAGIVMLLGLLHSRLTFTSVIVAIFAHLGLALGRWLSIALDGMPADNLFKATIVETILGALAIFVLIKYQEPN